MSQTPISEKVDRIEEIIETLESGEVSLERARTLHEEGQSLVEDLEMDLDVGEGTVLDAETGEEI